MFYLLYTIYYLFYLYIYFNEINLTVTNLKTGSLKVQKVMENLYNIILKIKTYINNFYYMYKRFLKRSFHPQFCTMAQNF